MKLYMAGDSMTEYQRVSIGMKDVSLPRPWRVLLSWYYYQKADLDEVFSKYLVRPYPELFLDSGAFSAFMQGVTISLSDYAAWIKKYQHLITLYANLDVIKDAESTWRNQQRLEQEYGLSPLPVFHVSEPWDMLERYLATYPYIALGVAGTRSHVYMPWLVKCFKMAEGRAVYHGFGITTWEVLKAFPWYSVDSSSWGQGFRFGNVPVFDERQGKFIKVQLGDYQSCYAYAWLIRSYGFDPSDFAHRSRGYRQHICALSALSYMKAEHWLTKRWGEVSLPDGKEIAPCIA